MFYQRSILTNPTQDEKDGWYFTLENTLRPELEGAMFWADEELRLSSLSFAQVLLRLAESKLESLSLVGQRTRRTYKRATHAAVCEKRAREAQTKGARKNKQSKRLSRKASKAKQSKQSEHGKQSNNKQAMKSKANFRSDTFAVHFLYA